MSNVFYKGVHLSSPILQINQTFDTMSVIIDALHAWSEGTSGLKFLTKKGSVLSKLKVKTSTFFRFVRAGFGLST